VLKGNTERAYATSRLAWWWERRTFTIYAPASSKHCRITHRTPAYSKNGDKPMKFASVVAVCVLGLAACSDGPTTPGNAPTIRGTIQELLPDASFFVTAGPDSLSCDIHERARVYVNDASIVRRSGGRASSIDLAPGVVVSVWAMSGAAPLPCPGIIGADSIVVED
jgi:hypothetical protein